MKLPRDLERQILAQAESVGPSVNLPEPKEALAVEKNRGGYPATPAVCVDCGIAFLKRGPMHKYCEACSTGRHVERQRKWARANPSKIPKEVQRTQRAARTEAVVEAGKVRSQGQAETIAWDAGAPAGLAWHVRFAIPFSYLASKNAIYRTTGDGHVFVRREARAFRDELTLLVKGMCQTHNVVQAKVWIDILVQKPNHRGDAINVVDLVADAIKDGLGVDDRWFCIRRLDWQIVKEDPQIIVGIGQAARSHRQVCSHCGLILKLGKFNKKKSAPMGVDRACVKCRKLGREMKSQ